LYHSTYNGYFNFTVEEEQRELALIKESSGKTSPAPGATSPKKMVTIRVESEDDGCHLTVPQNMNASSSNETLTGEFVTSRIEHEALF